MLSKNYMIDQTSDILVARIYWVSYILVYVRSLFIFFALDHKEKKKKTPHVMKWFLAREPSFLQYVSCLLDTPQHVWECAVVGLKRIKAGTQVPSSWGLWSALQHSGLGLFAVLLLIDFVVQSPRPAEWSRTGKMPFVHYLSSEFKLLTWLRESIWRVFPHI
jgi:hypothetical protein